MIRRNLVRFVATILILLVSFSDDLYAQDFGYDLMLPLKGVRRYSSLKAYTFGAVGRPTAISALADWVKINGDETEKEIFATWSELYGLEKDNVPVEVIITAIEKHIQKAIIAKNSLTLANLYHYMFNQYKKLKLYNKSMEYSLYCIEELKKDPMGVYFEQSWPLYVMGLDFYYYKDYDKALEFAHTAFRYNDINNANRLWFLRGCSDLLGMIYLKKGSYDSAKKWLDITMHHAKMQHDTGWIGIASGNIGWVHYLQKQYDKAIPNLELGLKYCRKYDLWDNISPFAISLAECYMATGQTATVTALLNEADFANRNNTQPAPINYVDYFKTVVKWHRNNGNTNLALQYMDSLNFHQQKSDEEFSVIAKMEAEANLAFRSKELENIVLKQEEKKGRLIRYGLIGLLLMGASISILLYKRQNLRHQLKKEKLELDKMKAEEELHLAITEIKDFTYHIVEKNKLIESYTEEIEKLKKQNASITEEQLASLEIMRNATVLTDEEWAAFKKMFEKVHPGFLQRLKLNYPDLTAAETRYLAFTKLNITPKEMASMLGVSAEAVRSIRFRIKKKLNVDDNNELDRMANEI